MFWVSSKVKSPAANSIFHSGVALVALTFTDAQNNNINNGPGEAVFFSFLYSSSVHLLNVLLHTE